MSCCRAGVSFTRRDSAGIRGTSIVRRPPALASATSLAAWPVTRATSRPGSGGTGPPSDLPAGSRPAPSTCHLPACRDKPCPRTPGEAGAARRRLRVHNVTLGAAGPAGVTNGVAMRPFRHIRTRWPREWDVVDGRHRPHDRDPRVPGCTRPAAIHRRAPRAHAGARYLRRTLGEHAWAPPHCGRRAMAPAAPCGRRARAVAAAPRWTGSQYSHTRDETVAA